MRLEIALFHLYKPDFACFNNYIFFLTEPTPSTSQVRTSTVRRTPSPPEELPFDKYDGEILVRVARIETLLQTDGAINVDGIKEQLVWIEGSVYGRQQSLECKAKEKRSLKTEAMSVASSAAPSTSSLPPESSVSSSMIEQRNRGKKRSTRRESASNDYQKR